MDGTSLTSAGTRRKSLSHGINGTKDEPNIYRNGSCGNRLLGKTDSLLVVRAGSLLSIGWASQALWNRLTGCGERQTGALRICPLVWLRVASGHFGSPASTCFRSPASAHFRPPASAHFRSPASKCFTLSPPAWDLFHRTQLNRLSNLLFL